MPDNNTPKPVPPSQPIPQPPLPKPEFTIQIQNAEHFKAIVNSIYKGSK